MISQMSEDTRTHTHTHTHTHTSTANTCAATPVHF